MKEIGEQFKEKREEIGITIEEVAVDLDLDPILIDNLEDGNNKVFKDMLELKDIISKYAKYLGLDSEKLVDEFNDFLYEKTSKISIDDIKEELSKTKPVEKKIKSPYTTNIDKKSNTTFYIIMALIILILLALTYFLLRKILIG